MEKAQNLKPSERFAAQWLRTVPGLCYREKNGVVFWQSRLLAQTNLVRHGFTTRKGGVSRGSYKSMNLSVTRHDGLDTVKQNYAKAADALGMDIAHAVLVDGVHGIHIKPVSARNRGDGLLRAYEGDREHFDGMVTSDPAVALITIHADCAPLFVLDPVQRAIGLCHAGWRGTVEGMGREILLSMRRNFGSQPKDLLCMIGPHIGPCCFEVHGDVAERFNQAFPGFAGVRKAREEGKYFVDLAKALAWQLFEEGVEPEKVNVAHLCTCCNPALFHSFRRDGMQGGAMASFLQLNPPQ